MQGIKRWYGIIDLDNKNAKRRETWLKLHDLRKRLWNWINSTVKRKWKKWYYLKELNWNKLINSRNRKVKSKLWRN